jgi:membrane protein implicated in regulation of membrane protease activity
MEMLPYWVTGAGVIAAIVIGIIVGGWLWLLTAVAVVIGVVYLIGDRRLKQRETPGERLSSDPRACRVRRGPSSAGRARDAVPSCAAPAGRARR